MKNKWLIFSSRGIFSVMIIGLFTSPTSFLIFLSDSYFTIGLLLLIIGLFGLILKQGTFDFFHYSLNQAKNRFFRSQEENPDEERLHRLSRSIPLSYQAFIKAGTIFLFGSLICILIYSL